MLEGSRDKPVQYWGKSVLRSDIWSFPHPFSFRCSMPKISGTGDLQQNDRWDTDEKSWRKRSVKGKCSWLLSLVDQIKPQVRYLQNSWERHSLAEAQILTTIWCWNMSEFNCLFCLGIKTGTCLPHPLAWAGQSRVCFNIWSRRKRPIFLFKMADIQEKSLPVPLRRKDMPEAARSGSSKTSAFSFLVPEVLYSRKWSTMDGLRASIVSQKTKKLVCEFLT